MILRTSRARPAMRDALRGVCDAGVAVRLAAATALGALYAVGALLPFWFLTSPEGGAAFFPSAGLTLAVLVSTPRRCWRRCWPSWLVAVAVAEIFVNLCNGLDVTLSVGFAAANVAQPLVGATALGWVLGRRPSVTRADLVAFTLCCVVAGPLVGATIGATVSSAFGGAAGSGSILPTWWLGDALGVLVVATPILAWRARTPTQRPMPWLELMAISVLATAVAVVPALLWHHPMLYIVLPILMWAALRGGVRAVSIAGLFVAFAADWAAVTGRTSELLAANTPDDHLIFVQLFLGLTLLAMLTLAVEVTERHRLEGVARDAEADRERAERAAADAAAGERRRIARETHDITGHALNVMLLHAGAARRVLEVDAALTRQSLEAIEDAGRGAFGDLDLVLGSDASEDEQPHRGIADIRTLVDVWGEAGMAVTLETGGEPWKVSSLVDWSAYRIVQEALTNAAKYAPGASVHVAVCFEPDALRLSIVDDGAPTRPVGVPSGGRGLVGIGERVAMLSGSVQAGPEGPGFSVRARLPARTSPP